MGLLLIFGIDALEGAAVQLLLHTINEGDDVETASLIAEVQLVGRGEWLPGAPGIIGYDGEEFGEDGDDIEEGR